MTTQENSIGSDESGHPVGHAVNSPASLVEIANQLSEGQPEKPEVVFVGNIDEESPEVAQAASHMSEVKSEYKYPVSFDVKPVESPQDSVSMVMIDPFSQEVSGEIPAMPTLPVIRAEELTNQVVARESEGDHHAWRLLSSQRTGTENGKSAIDPVSGAKDGCEDSGLKSSETGIVESDVADCCGEGEDCFFAYPGEVISIDGNQGFDHIDLRSFSIEDATFQPGAIVLHNGTDPTLVADGETTPQPVTIKHRGVEFAIFSGDVRVDL